MGETLFYGKNVKRIHGVAAIGSAVAMRTGRAAVQ